jgi:preprotein translocase subunit SecB
MIDTPQVEPQTNEGQTANMQVLAQYIRDFSFENPRAPESFRSEGRPEIDMGVEMSAKGRPDGLFDVELKISAKAKGSEGIMFTIELIYGGLFQLGNIPPHMVEPTLLVECPRYLFPFARRIIADISSDGGFFPPLMVDPIDFAALYMQQKANGLGVVAGQA